MARRIVTPLSDKTIKAKIRQFESSGKSKEKIPDGNCLYLFLERSKDGLRTNSRWTVIHKGRERGVGSYPDVSLAEARRKRDEVIEMQAAGIDPKEERRRERLERAQEALLERRRVVTFNEVAERYIRTNEVAWERTNLHRATKARGYLQNHLGPVFGSRPVAEIDFRDAVSLVEKLKKEGKSKDLVKKCANLTKEVLKMAQAEGLRDENARNPFDNSGPYGALAGPVLKTFPKEESHPMIQPQDAPEFFAQLCNRPPSASRDALIFEMLTTLRGNAVTAAEWGAIDWDEPMLVVPDGPGRGSRKTKNNGPYWSYLSSYAVALLKSRAKLEGAESSPYVFTYRGDAPLSLTPLTDVINVMNKERRKHGLPEWRDRNKPLNTKGREKGLYPHVVPHGVSRRTFSTWAHEDMHGNDRMFTHDIVELVLDHDPDKIKGGSVAARYDQSIRKNRRLELVEAWGRYLVTGKYPDEPDGEPCEGWKKIIESK